jgi:lipopolysaccharide transport system permease protein
MIVDDASAPPDRAPDYLVFESGRADLHYWVDLWRFRELFLILAWRDVAVRYKQTVIGLLWAVLRPFLTMVVFTLIFGRLAKLPSDGGAPYALMVFAGMLPWYLVASALSGAAESIVSNASLIGKVYFPRMILPASAIITAVIDFLISFAILIGLMIWYRFVPGWQIAFLPLLTLAAIIVSLGPGLLFTALNVRYRDFRYIIPFTLQFGLYISPVGFSSAAVPEQWRLLYSLNPMVGVIDAFRWCLLGAESPVYAPGFLLSMGVAVAFVWLGVTYFRRTEKQFADLV